MNCGVWGASVKGEVHGVKSAVWSVKKMFAWCCVPTWSQAGHLLWKQQHNKFAQSTHARRTAHTSSIDEKGSIIKSKATSAPPRAGTTGLSFLFIIWIMINTSSTYNISFMYSLHSLFNNTRVTCSSALSGHPSSSVKAALTMQSWCRKKVSDSYVARTWMKSFFSVSDMRCVFHTGCPSRLGRVLTYIVLKYAVYRSTI